MHKNRLHIPVHLFRRCDQTYLVDVLALELGDELGEPVLLSLDTNGLEERLDVSGRGGGVATLLEEEVSGDELHLQRMLVSQFLRKLPSDILPFFPLNRRVRLRCRCGRKIRNSLYLYVFFVVTQTDLSCWSGRCVYCKKPKEDSLTQSLRKLPAASVRPSGECREGYFRKWHIYGQLNLD